MATASSVISALTAVFDSVFSWISTALTTIIGVFYADGALTFLGVLALVGLAISIFFLLVSVISNFLHLRG